MSDYSISIVFPSVSSEDAERIGQDLLQWLQAERVLGSELQDCVLGRPEGYPPGENYVAATDEPDEFLQTLQTNGAELITKRTVFDTGGNGFEIVCPSCSKAIEDLKPWGEAVDEWFTAAGPGMLACPNCPSTRAVTDWTYEPPFGFANLGITFWNWPDFAPAFLEAIASRVGHVPHIVYSSV